MPLVNLLLSLDFKNLFSDKLNEKSSFNNEIYLIHHMLNFLIVEHPCFSMCVMPHFSKYTTTRNISGHHIERYGNPYQRKYWIESENLTKAK